jgi:hypothetical protein
VNGDQRFGWYLRERCAVSGGRKMLLKRHQALWHAYSMCLEFLQLTSGPIKLLIRTHAHDANQHSLIVKCVADFRTPKVALHEIPEKAVENGCR